MAAILKIQARIFLLNWMAHFSNASMLLFSAFSTFANRIAFVNRPYFFSGYDKANPPVTIVVSFWNFVWHRIFTYASLGRDSSPVANLLSFIRLLRYPLFLSTIGQ